MIHNSCWFNTAHLLTHDAQRISTKEHKSFSLPLAAVYPRFFHAGISLSGGRGNKATSPLIQVDGLVVALNQPLTEWLLRCLNGGCIEECQRFLAFSNCLECSGDYLTVIEDEAVVLHFK